jgi:hypothetical protein
VGPKIRVHIDAELVQKLRDKAVGDGIPDADTIPDEELLAALIRAELAQGPPPSEEEPSSADEPLPSEEEPSSVDEPAPSGGGTPVTVTPPAETIWVRFEHGLNLRDAPENGAVIRILADRERLTVLDRQDGWLYVQTLTDLTGWVAAEYITAQDPYPDIPPKGNVRGIHGAAGYVAPPRELWDRWIDELKAMGMAWYKQIDAGDPNDIGPNTTFAWACHLKRHGIEPIIRYYRAQMFPDRLQDFVFDKVKRYASEGIVWCEIGNEPNLDHVEWQPEHHGRVNWQLPYYPRTIATNWVRDAERVVAAGGRPGFYALAPTDWREDRPHSRLSSVMFYQRMFEKVAADTELLGRFRRLFLPGKAWLAVHVATYERPPDFNPFPPGEPPYDMCLRGYEVPLRYLREILEITQAEVISTEGGVFTKDSASMEGHPRLADHQEHASRTVEMFEWIQNKSPLRAMCPWLISNVYQTIGHSDPAWAHDGWYDGGPMDFKAKPVVQELKATRPIL